MEFGVTVGDSIDRLDETAEGFDFAEFGLAEAVNVPESIDDGRLRDTLEKRNVDIDVHLPFKQVLATPIPEINDAIVAHQRRLLEWAGSVNARKAVLHGTVRNPHDTDQRSIAASQLTKIVAAGSECDVEVVVENVGHQRHGLQLSVLGDIAEETNTPVCFDVGHAYMEDGTDGIKRFLKYYGDLISHLHAHDVRSRGDTHIPVGAGEIDYGIVSEYLGDFDGTVAIEVFTDDVDLLRDTASRVANCLGEEF